jgi:hypothetical protein
MRCFYHPQIEAVGICKHCQRGICHECASERDGGLACRGRCEASVDAVTALIRRNVQVGVKARPINFVAFAVFAVAVIVLFYLAVNEENRSVRTILYVVTAFSFVAVLGQLSVIRTMLMRKSRQ